MTSTYTLLSDHMPPPGLLVILCGVITLCFYWIVSSFAERRRLAHIPTIGFDTPLLTYISAYRYLKHARETMEEGYSKYPTGIFKVPTMTSWLVIANGTRFVQEIGKSNDEDLSTSAFFHDLLQLDYTLGKSVRENPYHEAVVRTAMTRNIEAQYADLREELLCSFRAAVPLRSCDDWVEIPAFDTAIQIASRVSATLSVGRPLCENLEFREICLRSGEELESGRTLRYFPTFLRSFASHWITNVHADLDRLAEMLRPLVNYRLSFEVGNTKQEIERPNDLLSWLLDGSRKAQSDPSPRSLATRLYFLAFASHAVAIIITCALYELASRQDDQDTVRQELEAIIENEGWSKESTAKMYKLDSFLRETLRIYDPQLLHLGRKATRTYTLSDGTIIPSGTFLQVNSWSIHHDPSFFPSPSEFRGFRFVIPEENDPQTHQHMLAKPTLDCNVFGYGRHACPGRFYAATVIKTMIAQIVLEYDLKVADGAQLSTARSQSAALPDKNLGLALRRRADVVSA